MRRYTITVNDTTRVIDVEEVTADTYRVQIEGRFVDVRLDDHRGLAHAAIAPTVEVARGAAAAASGPAPTASGSATPTTARPAPAASGVGTTAPAASGRADRLTAPMPGVLLQILVAAGDRVTRGQPLAVLEAMKMKNELKAPRDAVVAEVFATQGQQVKYGEALLRFEER